MTFKKLLVAVTVVLFGIFSAKAQIAIPNTTPVTQNFDGIGNTATAALPV